MPDWYTSLNFNERMVVWVWISACVMMVYHGAVALYLRRKQESNSTLNLGDRISNAYVKAFGWMCVGAIAIATLWVRPDWL